MENIKDYQQYIRGYNYTGITPVIIVFLCHLMWPLSSTRPYVEATC